MSDLVIEIDYEDEHGRRLSLTLRPAEIEADEDDDEDEDEGPHLNPHMHEHLILQPEPLYG